MLRDFESDRQRLFTRRALLLGSLQAGVFGVLASRMYYLQVTEGVRYALLAEDNRINHRLLAAPRGLILDRFGQKLAVNEQNFRLMLVPEQVGNIDAMLRNISTFVPLDERDLRRIRRDIQRNRSFAPLTIADNLTWDQAAAVELRLPDLEGVSIDVGQIRHYPFGEATAHILGYVSAVNEDELKADS
jgi:penicillin-binding protein 2